MHPSTTTRGTVPAPDLGSQRPTQHLSPVQAEHRAAVFAKLATGEYRFEEVPICLCGAAAEGRKVVSVGCEYSSTFAAAARERGTAVRSGGIETLLNTGLSPELVIMSHVVEHFPDPSADLRLVRGLVLSETILYVEVPG